MLLLERRYSPLRGVAIRIRKLHLADIKEGALVDGPQLFFADLGYQIDNMEGIAVHNNAQGETILTLVSDDNFSAHPAQSAAAIRATIIVIPGRERCPLTVTLRWPPQAALEGRRPGLRKNERWVRSCTCFAAQTAHIVSAAPRAMTSQNASRSSNRARIPAIRRHDAR